jgi:hypothetical protein
VGGDGELSTAAAMGESGRKRTAAGEYSDGVFLWAACLGVANASEGGGAWPVEVRAGGEGWIGGLSAGRRGLAGLAAAVVVSGACVVPAAAMSACGGVIPAGTAGDGVVLVKALMRRW